MAAMADDMAELRQQLATARSTFDAFVAETRAKAAAAKATHAAVMAESKGACVEAVDPVENLAKAQEAFNQVKQVEGSVAARRVLGGERTEAEHDRREAIRLEGELGMLREQRNTAAERRAQLSREIDQLREQVRAEQQALDLQQKQKQVVINEYKRAVDFYQDRLGLKFVKSTDGNLTVIFVRVLPSQPNQPCSFTLRVNSADQYELVNCSPPVEGLDDMVVELNRSNNLSKFVRDIRKAFRTAMVPT